VEPRSQSLGARGADEVQGKLPASNLADFYKLVRQVGEFVRVPISKGAGVER